jgi:ubiquitin C-terminal hydrolase
MNAALQCLSATQIFVAYFRGTGKGHGEYKKDLKHSTIRAIAEEKRKKLKDTEKEIVVKISDVKKRFRESLTYKLRNLLVVMWGVNCKVKPKTFKHSLGNFKSTFLGYSQNDSQECLSFILDQIHEETKTDVLTELKNLPNGMVDYQAVKEHYTKMVTNEEITLDERIKFKEDFNNYRNEHLKEDAIMKSLIFWQKFLKKNHSVIIDIFTGLFFNQVKCSGCGNVNFSFEPFNLVSLPIPRSEQSQDLTLDDCLMNHFNCDELLTGDNKYNCDVCSVIGDANKKTSMWHNPSHLIIQFKRFVNTEKSTSKNRTNIVFPILGLDMKKYSSEYTNDEAIYDLYGVINHSGNLGGGHYVAYTKNPINNNWYLFDDDDILHIEDDKLESKIVNSGAYVLFYKKRGHDELVPSVSDDEDDIP